MTPPTVDRFRFPYRRVVPGDDHPIFIHWEGDPDVSASTFTVTMVDAYTAVAVTGVTYTIDATQAAVGVITASAPIPTDIDTDALYEIRVRQDGETIIAGAVQFPSTTVPVTP